MDIKLENIVAEDEEIDPDFLVLYMNLQEPLNSLKNLILQKLQKSK